MVRGLIHKVAQRWRNSIRGKQESRAANPPRIGKWRISAVSGLRHLTSQGGAKVAQGGAARGRLRHPQGAPYRGPLGGRWRKAPDRSLGWRK